jgi:hypothetical protein
MNDSKLLFFMKSHKFLAALIPFALLIALAFGIPRLIGDGTNRFTGIKKEAAKEVLKEVYATQDPMSRVNILAFQFYVEDVYPMNPQSAKSYCNLSPGDDGKGYYAVDVSQVTLFGVRGERFTRLDGCVSSRFKGY